MKILTITKGIASEYFHTQAHHIFNEFLSQIALTALKYETPKVSGV